MKPHKHADLIHAWADGHPIQWKNHADEWVDVEAPVWGEREYRIKPEEKKPVVRWLWAKNSASVRVCYDTIGFKTEEEASAWVERGAIKLEWSKTEFPE